MEFKGQNGDTGAYEGYISIKGNVDLGGDIVMPGAFRDVKTTRDGYLRMVYGHDMTKIIGKAKLIEDSTGYLVKGALNMKLSYVPDIYEQMKDGTLDGMSFGYSVNAGGADIKSVNGAIVRELKSLTVYEGSVVPFGMNPSAGVLAVKSMYEQQVLHKIYNSLSLFSAG
jgi:HK97 family phage prohead protease